MPEGEFQPWFRSRHYGHSLYPVSPEGWITVLAWLFILVGSTMVMMAAMLHAAPSGVVLLFILWALVILADTAGLFYIRHIKSQRSHWREWRVKNVKDSENR